MKSVLNYILHTQKRKTEQRERLNLPLFRNSGRIVQERWPRNLGLCLTHEQPAVVGRSGEEGWWRTGKGGAGRGNRGLWFEQELGSFRAKQRRDLWHRQRRRLCLPIHWMALVDRNATRPNHGWSCTETVPLCTNAHQRRQPTFPPLLTTHKQRGAESESRPLQTQPFWIVW